MQGTQGIAGYSGSNGTNGLTQTSSKCYLVGTIAGSGEGTYLYYYTPYMQSGEVYAGSDINLKKNIQPIDNTFIKALFDNDNITYEFDWKETDKHSIGFIAQYISDIMPECVDFDDDRQTYTVNYNAALSKIVGALFKKVKEQDIVINNILNKI